MSTGKKRMVRYTVPVAAAALVLTSFAGSANAVDRGTFELDGNATDSSTVSGHDWNTALTPGGNPPLPTGQLANTGVVVDPLNQTIFTGGGSKDDLDIPSWQHTNGSVPDKDEITNAYASAYNKNGDLVVYFGADRFATNGNAALGFWFFQDDVMPGANGKFTGAHTKGDLLVLSEFTNGGSQPTIQVYEWTPGGPINGTLKLLTNNSSTCNATQSGTSDPIACAIVNTGPVTSPWPYQPKSGAAGTFAKGAFFEGGINVSRLAALAGHGTPCFTGFLAETRSSQSVDATLKDLVAGDFNLCDAKVTINGSAVNEVNDPHTFTVKVTKTVAGTESAVEGAKPVVTLAASNGAAPTLISDTCATPGTNSAGECTVTFNSASAGTIVGSATVTFDSGGQTFTRSTGTTAATGAAVKRYVDAKIGIEKSAVNGIGESHTFTVNVQKDEGRGAGFEAAPGAKPTVSLTDTNGDAVAPRSESCSTGTDAAGNCTVTFSSSKPTTITGSASVSIVFQDQDPTRNITVTRSTDGKAPNSGAAVKQFVDGSLTWLKVDQDGKPLGGATFEVCQTHSYNSESKAHTALAEPVCRSVKDDDASDAAAAAGTLKLTGLKMGTYTVQETAAPAGYSFDKGDIKTAKLETMPESARDAVIATAFVNTQLYKMIVITCNQVSNAPVKSTTTLGGSAKDTPTSDLAAQVCAQESEFHTDLRKATHNPSVEIPAPTTP